MKRAEHALQAIVAAWMFGCLAGLVSHAAPFELIPSSSIDRTTLAAPGRFFLEREMDVVTARSKHFIVVGSTRAQVGDMAREAEMAYDRICRVFPAAAEPEQPAYLFFVNDAEVWSDMVREYQLREDGLALQVGRELYFNHRSTNRPDRIFHEMVHLRLREVFPEREIPLWLEEGLAGFYGWRHTIEFHEREGYAITRDFPPVRADELIDLSSLLAGDTYPADAAEARIFYRQAEVLTGLLVERLGRDGMASFTALMSTPDHGQTPVELFRSASGLDEAGERAMVEAMQKRILSGANP